MSQPNHFVDLLQRAESKCIPLEVFLELTHRCNLRCEHCYVPDHARQDAVSTSRWLRLLNELAELGTLFLVFTGGEMLLNPDWLAVAREARRLGFSLRLFSNGIAIDEATADAIAGLPAGVDVTIYSLDPDVVERITGVPGALERTLRGVEVLRQRGIEMRVKLPIMTHNLASVGAVFDLAERLGVECRPDPRIVHRQDGSREPTRLQAAQADLISFYRDRRSGLEGPDECRRRPRHDGALCAAGTRMATVTASGEVLACNVLPESAGNVNRSSFREIWTGSPWFERLRGIRRRHLRVCDTCERFAYCRRCLAQALVMDGDLLGPASWSCAHAAALETVFPSAG